jgi:hypothetical protein
LKKCPGLSIMRGIFLWYLAYDSSIIKSSIASKFEPGRQKMKKLFILLFISVMLFGCSKARQDSDVVVRINDYIITRAEFEKDFKDSSYGRFDTVESRREFVNNLVDRILILQDAEKKSLDKDPKFLGMVEKFWEQSLLRVALEKKSREVAGSAYVSDKTVEDAYQKMLKDGKVSKPYDAMYQQIKWDITKLKESQLISDWIADLHKNSDVKISDTLIDSTK